MWLLIFVLACAPKAAPVEPTPVDVVEEATAPPPFTAAQIRDATGPGRTYVFRITTGDGTFVRRMVFTAVSEGGAVVQGTNTRDDGTRIDTQITEPTWDELVAHALYPASATTIGEGSVTVAAGTFDCLTYRVAMPDGHVDAWFAQDLPGAPVRFVQTQRGAVVFEMELLEHVPGGATAP